MTQPTIVVTPELIAALNQLVDLAQYDLDEGYRRDDELVAAITVVRNLLTEINDATAGGPTP